MNKEGEKAPEILIIRRGSGDDLAAHKGGAWKIAYADFVTAMMAFFLVMWLINSANEVTKARVASYFNPIKMTDASPSRRGLKEVHTTSQPRQREDETVDESAGNGSKRVGESSSAGVADLQREPNLTISESELLLDPFRTLDEIVRNGKGLVEQTMDGANTQIIGDPFDPRSHEALKNAERSPYEGNKEKLHGEAGKSKPDHGRSDGAVSGPEGAVADPMTEGEDAGGPEKPDIASSAKAAQLEKAQANALRGEIEEIHAQYRELLDVDVSVRVTDEGILVAIEDRKKGSMFAVGSAVPSPVLVEFIGKVGAALAEFDNPVVVRGHTDARQFANKVHDNWQLSTARAHISSYMLMRGGLPESRLAKIEGFGSAKLLVPEDPLADANRRVEFLLLH